MDVRDGFIIGIFNYCDRWCEACAFTSRCGVFADSVKAEASLDPALKELVEAPPLPEDLPPPPPKWMEELIGAMNEAAREPASDEDSRRVPPSPPQDHLAIETRATAYMLRVDQWLEARDLYSRSNPGDPCAVITWFHTLMKVKIHRALWGLAQDDPEDRDFPADHDGSAKVALLGIERSHASWLDLVDRGIATGAEAAPFIADLVWLADALDRTFPNARRFVRPGFDEPDEVAKLLAQEARG
jgi:hypothetical protein